jgi:chorismate mutase/prephenate dehydratase
MVEHKKPALGEVRSRIDALDEEILSRISERAALAQKVMAAKGKVDSTADYYRPEREAQVLRRIAELNVGPLSDAEIRRLFREIMSACLAQQEPLKIAFLGPEGTFTQQAVFQHFGHSIRALPWASIEEVFAEVEAGHADFGVVPVENSTEGAVNHTLDMFATSPLKICGEVETRIHHHLIGKASSLAEVRRVYSHQQSLAQCRGFLREHLPDAQRVAVSSNAEAVKAVRDLPDAMAIAGQAAADIYGLPVLMANVEDSPDNTTRFLVIGRKLFAPSGKDKTSLLVSAHDHPGALYQLLEPFERHGVSLSKIESRPSRKGRWRYVFFLDLIGHAEDEAVAAALNDLESRASVLRVLGSYPLAG